MISENKEKNATQIIYILYTFFTKYWDILKKMTTPLNSDTITQKLNNNITKILLKDLRKKEMYLKINACVDGREDKSGIPSFGGAAGTLIAMYCALRDLFWWYVSQDQLMWILKKFVWDIKIYLHDDTHIQQDNQHKHPCECKNIWCGAVARLLKDEDAWNGQNARWLNQDERNAFRSFLKDHSEIKVLDDQHQEETIHRLKNTPEIDENEEQYIYSTKTNKKADGQQDFVYHETGRNLIIGYMAEDMVDTLLSEFSPEDLHTYYNQTHKAQWDVNNGKIIETVSYRLKQKTIERADKHTNLTANDLIPARKLIEYDRIAVITEIDPQWWHNILIGKKNL